MEKSKMSNFFSGMRSGATSSLTMLSIFTGLGFAAGALGLITFNFVGFGAIGLVVAATSIFSGIMNVKRAGHGNAEHQLVPVPTSQGHVPTMGMSQTPDLAQEAEAPGQATSKWTDRIGGSRDAQAQVQQILANGSMSDKDRAAAILAARENAAGHSQSL